MNYQELQVQELTNDGFLQDYRTRMARAGVFPWEQYEDGARTQVQNGYALLRAVVEKGDVRDLPASMNSLEEALKQVEVPYERLN